MSEHITVVLITYERTDYALRTVRAANANLQYPNWSWFVADDGSDPSHTNALLSEIERSDKRVAGLHSQRASYGRSANAGIETAFQIGDLVLMLEDDWELSYSLDLWKYAALLMERDDIGMVRMGYLNDGLQGTLLGHQGHLYWALDDHESREHSRFAFAGHPALIHRRFFDAHGVYPENWQPGETELHMCWQVSEKREPQIVWPVELGGNGPWAHIGGIQSYVWNGGVMLEGELT